MNIKYVFDKPLQYDIHPGQNIRIGGIGRGLFHFVKFVSPYNVLLKPSEHSEEFFVTSVDGWGVYVPAILVSDLVPRLEEIKPYGSSHDGYGRDLINELIKEMGVELES